MERDGGVMEAGRWEMEEEWKERGMEGAGDLKKLNKFLKRKITTSLPRVQLR